MRPGAAFRLGGYVPHMSVAKATQLLVAEIPESD
jgi:hypothetical protein